MFQAPTPRVKESYLKPIKSGNHFLSEISLDVQVPPFLKDLDQEAPEFNLN
jgi:hypothetical protein